jgi:hypothetical protein
MRRALRRRVRSFRRFGRRHAAVDAVVSRPAIGLWRSNLRRRARKGQAAPDAGRLLWMSPAEVEFVLDVRGNSEFPSVRPLRNLIGTVLDGDWDTAQWPLTSRSIFDSVIERYVEGKRWSRTQFYQEVDLQVAAGIPRLGCRSHEDVERRFQRVDHLYEAIESEGYRTQHELGGGRPWDEILVAIDRNGRILFVDGMHRLAIARALRLERVPVLVLARHELWFRFTQEVRAHVDKQGGRSHEPVPHPDLADVPSVHGHTRFDLLAKHLPFQTGRLLEIGANWGYFSHRFEALGLDCWAVEHSKREVYFIKRLRDACGRNFRIVDDPMLLGTLPREFDVALAVNVNHTALGSKERFEAFRRLLRVAQPMHLVVQGHLPGERHHEAPYADLQPKEFIDLIRHDAGLATTAEIGRGEDGRPLLLLTSARN